LEEVPDPRVDRGKDHDLVDLLVIALCTILVGGDSFYDMEEFAEVRLSCLKAFLRLRNGALSHDTFNRIFQALDERQLADSENQARRSYQTSGRKPRSHAAFGRQSVAARQTLQTQHQRQTDARSH